MNNKEVSTMECEKCGNTKLFYREESYEGNTNFIVNGNCEEVEDGGYNSEYFDGAISKIISKYYVCYNCNNTTKYKCYWTISKGLT